LTDQAPGAEFLGHRFRDQRLLQAALTHSSLAAGSRRGGFAFDRLEFLGDRVLGLVVAQMLLAAFEGESEGELGRRFAALVSEPSLAALAREAVLGAIHLDAGFAAAEVVLRGVFAPLVAGMGAPPRDPKTTLQEWAQGRGHALPAYRTLSAAGPAHAPHFVVEAEAAGRRASGEGGSKREAERAAAAALLAALEAP
jgi:ribonuclease-3